MDASKLAIFTKQKRFIEPLHGGRPNIGNRRRVLYLINVLHRKGLSNDDHYVFLT